MSLSLLERSPAPVTFTPELRWVLLRAFGPVHAPFAGRIDAPRAAALAGDLALVERIGARTPSARLVAELGSDTARGLALTRLQSLAGVQRLTAFLPELAAAVADASIPMVLLKFAGLHAGGYLVAGSRAAADVDVLVPEREARRASELLTCRGFFAAATGLADHHHLPPLHDREGRVVELHTRLPGLRQPGRRRFIGFEALQAAGALEPAPGHGGGVHLLRPELMAAYAVTHGLAQHGGADPYPITRVLADVIDVLPDDRRTRGMQAAAWISADVPASRLEAVLELCDALEQGDLDGLDARPENHAAAALLHHALASALDPDYRRALAVTHLFHALADEPRWWRFLKKVQCLVLPSKAQLAARLGIPSARLITPRLRLAHAVALAGRLPRLARAALHRRGRAPSDTRRPK